MHHSEMMEESFDTKSLPGKSDCRVIKGSNLRIVFFEVIQLFHIPSLEIFSFLALCKYYVIRGSKIWSSWERVSNRGDTTRGRTPFIYENISSKKTYFTRNNLELTCFNAIYNTLFKLLEVQQHKRISAQNCTILCINDQILFI